MPTIASLLRAGVPLSTDEVKIVDIKSLRGKFTQNLLQKGVALSLGDMRPKFSPNQGGGRYNFLVLRTLYIRVITIAHMDPAGRNEQALLQHWTFENQIADILTLSTSTGLTVPPRPISLTGAEWEFQIDNGRYSSFMGFEIEYPLALTNTCI